jgi:hypothetical protein
MAIGARSELRNAFPPKIAGRSCVPKRFAKFSNATGSPSRNAMFGIETPKGRTPLQGASLHVTSPRAKAPGLFCLTAPRSLGKCPNSRPRVKTLGFLSSLPGRACRHPSHHICRSPARTRPCVPAGPIPKRSERGFGGRTPSVSLRSGWLEFRARARAGTILA